MLKFWIILALTIYVISKIGNFFFRAGISAQPRYQQPPRQAPRPQSNPTPKEKKKGNIKGGEYVDFEEVK